MTSASGLAKSVQERLRNKSRESREDFQRTLTRFANERFLYRLGKSSVRERFILKGASLLTVWLPDPYRATRDIDVLISGRTDDEEIRALLTMICEVHCPEDAMHFDISNLVVESIRDDASYSGKRARFQSTLGNIRIAMQLDLGVGDALTIPPAEIDYPTILKTTPAPALLAYSRETTVAEKFEAIVKLDTRNSRMKDFHDLWALSEAFEFDGETLQHAIAACFERRANPWTTEIPAPLTTAFYKLSELEARWRNYATAGAILRQPPLVFEVVGERVIAFLAPIRTAIIAEQRFNSAWPVGGTWTSVLHATSEAR